MSERGSGDRKRNLTPVGRQPLRALILEDNPLDAEIVVRELRRAGYEPEWTRVESEEAFAAALSPELDIILSDYALPHFDGLHAVAKVRARGLDIPFILISGTLGEEAAVQALKEGVDDYLLKDRLTRLGAAVRSALDARRVRRARRVAEADARASEERFRRLADIHAAMLDALPATVALVDEIGTIVAVNEAWRQFARDNGLADPHFCVGANYLEVCQRADGAFSEESAVAADGVAAVLEGARPDFILEYPCHAPNARRWFRLMATPLRRNERTGAVVMHVDITDRKAVEEELRKLSVAVEQSPVSIVITDTNAQIEYVNPFLTSVSGYAPQDLLGRNPRIWKGSETPPETYEDMWRTITSGGTWNGELQNVRKDGTPIWEQVQIAPLRNAAGEITNYVAVKQDVTERRRAEEAVRAARERLQQVVESSGAVIFAMSASGASAPEWVSANVSRVLGFAPADVVRPWWWRDRLHPDDRVSTLAAASRVATAGSMSIEYRLRDAAGNYRWIHDERRVVRDSAAGPMEVVGSWLDVTEKKELERQFLHAQKIDAVGRLAGGIAHDFNNLLTVMIGYADLILADAHIPSTLRDDVKEIHGAGDRARTLVRRLLTFNRQHVVAPRVLDVNDVINDIHPMLRRLVGEDVDVTCALDPGIAPVRADAGHLEQVIVNLVVNARDAMPDGGTITIATGECDSSGVRIDDGTTLSEGRYVFLSVSDSGTGMDDTTKAKLFEPFFTTKAPGKGTGLGLSTVHGIVKQRGGAITVKSELGVGSTFTVFLPRATGDVDPVEVQAPDKSVRGGHETVLVIEDDEPIRNFCRSVLGRLGYRVLEAANPVAALGLFTQSVELVDLVLTDVVMPGMSGTELADRLIEAGATKKIVFMSGYAALALAPQRIPADEVVLLEKPFSPKSLARTVRAVLDRP